MEDWDWIYKRPVMGDEVWTTRDGAQIPVYLMSEGHVRNALRMILRRERTRRSRRDDYEWRKEASLGY